ncbi:alkylation response protein AidB-like acyl-CoA dehydrogenase [Bradyrhizobium sp. JR3.5]
MPTTMTDGTSSGWMTEERLAMQRVARDFTLKEIVPVANKLDPIKGDIPRELIERMGDLGFFGIVIPEKFGGLGLGAFEYCLVAEELARGWMSVASIIARGNKFYSAVPGAPDERRRKIALMAQGRYLGAAALSEPQTGSDLSSVACGARRDGETWIVNGNKYWCTFADGADFIRVLCRLHGPDGPMDRTVSVSVEKPKGELPKGVTGSPIPKIGYFGWKTWELHFRQRPCSCRAERRRRGGACIPGRSRRPGAGAGAYRGALDRSGAGRARSRYGLCERTRAVRRTNCEFSGNPLQDRNHGDRDRGGPAIDVPHLL